MRRRWASPVWLALGAAIWLGDCALVMLSQKLTFTEALWSGPSAGRLLIRLLVVVVCLFPALNHTFWHWGWRKELKSWQQGHFADIWQGAPDSTEKSKRILFYALRIANALRLSSYEQDKLRRLCYCYDLGMFVVDGRCQQQALDWERHIQLGARIAGNFRLLETIVPLILTHEEYYNGSGYYCLSGSRIPIQCRILQVALLFDHACGGKRPKRKAALEEALLELSYYAGTVLDPELVIVFQRLMRRPHLEQEEQEQILNLP